MCLTAALEPSPDGTVLVHDLAGEDAARWPAVAPRAVEAGFRSTLTGRLTSIRAQRAALNFYGGGVAVLSV